MTRSTRDIDGEAFQRLTVAAQAAGERGDQAGEIENLVATLALLAAPHPMSIHAPGEALVRAFDDAEPLLWEHMLDVSISVANALVGQSLADAIAWTDFCDAVLGLERAGESAFVQRLRSNLHAVRARLRGPTGEDALGPRGAGARYGGPRGENASTVQALAIAMEQVRNLLGRGDRTGALAMLDHGLSRLDESATRADEVKAVAEALRREILAPTPGDARLAIRDAHALMKHHSADENVQLLLIAAGYAIDAGRRDLALLDAQEALGQTMAGVARNRRWNVYGAFAEIEGCLGRLSSAILFDKLALREHCAVRSALADFAPELADLTERGANLIRRLVTSLVECGRLQEAETASAMFHAPDIADLVPPSLTRFEAEVEAAIFASMTTMESVQRILDAASARQADAGMILDPGPAGADTHAVHLSFLEHDGRMLCVIRRGKDVRKTALALSPEAANKLAYGVRHAVLDRRGNPDPVLQAAYAALLGPVIAADMGVSLLHISASGGLSSMPWAALHDGQAYLVERFALVRGHSTSSAAGRGRKDRALAAFGATRASNGKPALGETAAIEARAVATRSAIGFAMIDEAFTRTALEQAAKSASILHLATHFIADASDLGRSALVLGDGGAITLRDFASIGLAGVELVLLSACDTAIPGSVGEAAGVDALLLASGAAAVVGTLWPVDSAAMATIMPELVSQLGKGLATPHALAAAQRCMIQGEVGSSGYAHPYYFAGLVFAGDAAVRPLG